MSERIAGKSEKRKYAVFTAFASLFAILFILFGMRTEVRAGPLDSAQEYYATYGDRDVYFDRSTGYLYFFGRGRLSSSGIKYETLGWQAVVYDAGGNIADIQYFQLGGKIQKYRDDSPSGWSYELYRINARVLYDSFNEAGKNALDSPNSRIVLNAGNCVKIGGVPQGWLADGNAGSGVYYTYDGINNAEPWSPTTHEALKSYYDKEVPDMFYTVQVETENGAVNGRGGGRYMWGSKATISCDVADGYSFSNWHDRFSGAQRSTSTRYTFQVKSDTYLMASGTPNTYYIYFNSNARDPFTGAITGDTVSNMPGTKSYVYGSGNIRLPGNIPTRYGYDFKGWSTSSALGAKVNWNAGDMYGNIPRSQTLYAVWERHSYTQTNNFYQQTDGKWIWFMSTQHTAKYLDYYTNTKEWVYTPTGYHWWKFNTSGWTVKADKNDKDGYGYYLPNEYTIKYNGNGATSGSMRNGAEHGDVHMDIQKYDVTYKLSSLGYAKKGYHFLGWATSKADADKGIASYANSDTVRNMTTGKAGSVTTVTLYAVWEPNTYYVKYLGNGATSGGVGTQTCTYDKHYKYAANAGPGFKKETASERSIFRGWSLEKNGSSGIKAAGTDDLFNLTDVDQATVYVYAQWEKDNNDYTITVYPNGGTVTKAGTNLTTPFKIIGKYGSTFDLNVSKKTTNGAKYFDKWTWSENVDPLSDTTHPDFTFRGRIHGNGTLTANWANRITLTIDPNGGIVNGHTEKFTVEGKAGDPFILDFSFSPLTLADVTFNTTKCATTNCVYLKSAKYSDPTAGLNYYGYDAYTIDKTYYDNTAYSKSLHKCIYKPGAYSSTDSVMTPASGYTIQYASYSMVKSGSITVHWKGNPKVYKITLDSNGGTGGDSEFYEKYGIGYYADEKTTLDINAVTEIPHREGYEFLGYYTEKDSGTQIVNAKGSIVAKNTQFTADATIYAHWDKVTPPDTPYKVEHYLPNINPDTGAESYAATPTLTDEYLGYAGKIVTIADLAREDGDFGGYEFKYGTDSKGTKITTAMVVKDMTIKIYYTGRYFPVTTICKNGVSNISTVGKCTIQKDGVTYYKVGTKVTVTASLESGYTFSQWSSASAGVAGSKNNPYTFIMPGNAVTISGIAAKPGETPDVTWNIKYDLDGGYFDPDTPAEKHPVTYNKKFFEQLKSAGGDGNIHIAHPVKDIYSDFLGWTGTDLTGLTKDVVIKSGTTGDKAYTAHWDWHAFKITLDSKGIMMDGKTASAPASAGTDAYYEKYSVGNYSDSTCTSEIVKITIPVRTGYHFLGYYDVKTSESGAVEYIKYIDEDGMILASNKQFIEDTTLEALWEPEIYEISLMDKKTGDTEYNAYGAYYERYADANYDSSACTTPISSVAVPSRTGYIFQGYYTAASGGTKYVDASGKILSTPTTFTSDTKLYARWKAITYKIQFVANEPYAALNKAEISSNHPTTVTVNKDGSYTQTVTYDDLPVVLCRNQFRLKGYSFTGWNSQSDGKGALDYTDGSSITDNLTSTDGYTITLYAKWESDGLINDTKLVAIREDNSEKIGTATESSATYESGYPSWINSDAHLTVSASAPASGLKMFEVLGSKNNKTFTASYRKFMDGRAKGSSDDKLDDDDDETPCIISEEGTHYYYGRATDRESESKITKSLMLQIDKTAPHLALFNDGTPRSSSFSIILGSYEHPLTQEASYNADGSVNANAGSAIEFQNADGAYNSKAFGAKINIEADDWNEALADTTDSHDVSKIKSASLKIEDVDNPDNAKTYPVTVKSDGTIDYNTIIDINSDLNGATRLRFTLTMTDNAGNTMSTDEPTYAPDLDPDDHTIVDRGIYITTSIERTTPADDLGSNQFRGGYSGVLHITTTGWVDTVTLDWPSDILEAAGIDIDRGQPHMDYNVTIDMNPATNPDVVSNDSENTGFTRCYDFKFWVPIYIDDVIGTKPDAEAAKFDVLSHAKRERNGRTATASSDADLYIGGKNILYEFRSVLVN